MSLLLPTRIAVFLLAAQAIVFAIGAYRLGFWNDDVPGPGLLPLAAAILLLPLLILIMLREPVAGEEPLRAEPLTAIALAFGYAVVLPYAGFLLATFVLVVAWVRIFYRQGWIRIVLFGASLTSASCVLFALLLKVPMPLWPEWR